MKFLISLILYSFFILSGTSAAAQVSDGDSSFYKSAIDNALSLYQQSAGEQSRLFNGREYKPYRISFTTGHPFFLSDKFSEGSIIYEDGFYEHVQLLYNEVNGMVIAETGVSVELITERVREFTIAGHHFARLPVDSISAQLAAGFYETLYSGKIAVYKKEKKAIGEDLSDGEIKGVVTTKTYYYLKRNGQYYLIKNKNQVFDVLRDHRNEIQQFIRSKGLDFKHDTDNTLSKIAAYYDQLTR